VAQARNLGFPRIGQARELKFALERFWDGGIDETSLQRTAAELRKTHWMLQQNKGINVPPSNDFSLYDHVLDTALMLGAIPRRFASGQNKGLIDLYFRMARGDKNAPAMEMTKWFDTNYHYTVPEFESGMQFHLYSSNPVDQYREAKTIGIETRPVLLGPVSFVLLGKILSEGLSANDVLKQIIPVYREVLGKLRDAGADWVQIDEPCLVMDLDESAQDLYRSAYSRLLQLAGIPRIMLATYFASLGRNLPLAADLGVQGIHIDLVRGPDQLQSTLDAVPRSMRLSLGVIDGRNVWRSDLNRALNLIRHGIEHLGDDQVEIAPSCSLLHIPIDTGLEHKLDPELLSWMAFAKQKIEEVSLLALAAAGNQGSLAELERQNKVLFARRDSARVRNPEVRRTAAAIQPEMLNRRNPYRVRAEKQAATLKLPLLPTTTIGSFPQTPELRQKRASFRTGKLDRAPYEQFLEQEIVRCLRFQEEIGIDVLVHGEFERNDMVEYFGEQLSGFAFSQQGWVQSYGSRCVKPPIIFGDVARSGPMTVRWSSFAQRQTSRPVKGMLTGPVTILQWSFVRNDQPRSETCRQIALAIRNEVADLEAAGIRIIQIDEPAIREGLPLHREEWGDYLKWAVNCFRLASSGVTDTTQIHTHMCYSEFGDIFTEIARMDADVISIEASRSRMEILKTFGQVGYPNAIGPGVYDIHSPRIPETSEIESYLAKALSVLSREQLWVNPDCGLKTRKWDEVKNALRNLVSAAVNTRQSFKRSPGAS
jgi:5-methyltetrahydropteroyltriglutamate--homocysteine methyltransferase